MNNARQFLARVHDEQRQRDCSYQEAWCWVQLDAVTKMDFVLRIDLQRPDPLYEIDHAAWRNRARQAAEALLGILDRVRLH